jgi:DNA-binding transcriptional ArsR family regulator
MVKCSAEALDLVFGALGDAKRRAMIARLSRGDASVSELAGPLRMSLPAIHKHLGVLERAGLIEGHKQGRVRRVRLLPGPFDEARAWITEQQRFWEDRFDALADELEKFQQKDKSL